MRGKKNLLENLEQLSFQEEKNPYRLLFREMLYRAFIDCLIPEEIKEKTDKISKRKAIRDKSYELSQQKIKQEAISWVFDKENKLNKELPCVLVCTYAEIDYFSYTKVVKRYIDAKKKIRYNESSESLYKFIRRGDR